MICIRLSNHLYQRTITVLPLVRSPNNHPRASRQLKFSDHLDGVGQPSPSCWLHRQTIMVDGRCLTKAATHKDWITMKRVMFWFVNRQHKRPFPPVCHHIWTLNGVFLDIFPSSKDRISLLWALIAGCGIGLGNHRTQLHAFIGTTTGALRTKCPPLRSQVCVP